MNELSFMRTSINAREGVNAAIYKYRFLKDNPTYFDPDGIHLFCGAQGTGKSISLVRLAKDIIDFYPGVRVVSNMKLNFCDYEEFDIEKGFDYYSNGIEGVIFILDEVQTVFNSLESKNIPVTTIAALCQNRKNRRLILGTSQVYGRVAKPVREQMKTITVCKNFLKVFQFNITVDPAEEMEKDGHFSGKVIKKSFFFHSKELYEAYDTLEIIKRKR